MPLLERGHVIEDPWVLVPDDAPLPADAPAIVSPKRLPEARRPGRRLGVLLGPAARPEDVAAALPDLSLIAVEFPKFRDGRGFSLARTLRERYGFTGEIRAVGHILPDQYRFLLRCGVSTVALPEGADPGPWQTALGRFGVAYQPAAADEAPLDHLRRRLAAP
jgi:uncharacterized protein (DUF934 family)